VAREGRRRIQEIGVRAQTGDGGHLLLGAGGRVLAHIVEILKP
jgi:hypothetical protein